MNELENYFEEKVNEYWKMLNISKTFYYFNTSFYKEACLNKEKFIEFIEKNFIKEFEVNLFDSMFSLPYVDISVYDYINGICNIQYENLYFLISKSEKPPLYQRILTRLYVTRIFLNDYQKFKLGLWYAQQYILYKIEKHQKIISKNEFPKAFLKEIEIKEKANINNIEGGELSELNDNDGRLSLISH